MTDLKTHNNVTGLILAGGQARRMGGTDKGLVTIDGRSMISYIIDALTPQVATVIINANRNLGQYRAYGYPVVSDEIANYQGPLAGMASGLKHCQTDYIATVPCDGPILPDNYVDILLQAASHDGSQLSVGYDGNRLQPVYALIHKSLLEDLNQFLNSGERKIDRWYEKHSYARADFSTTPEMFTNINTPADLQKADQLI